MRGGSGRWKNSNVLLFKTDGVIKLTMCFCFFVSLQFVSLNGIQSSVPTVTTPTLTPSTLRSIEQDLFELTSDSGPSPYQAGFVPPPAQPSYHITGDNEYSNSNHSNGSDSEHSWNNSYDDSELANECKFLCLFICLHIGSNGG